MKSCARKTLVGLTTRTAAFRLQREINEYKREALLAAIPGIALSELWRAIGQFEIILRIITVFVLIAGLLGMLTTLLTTLNERRREMAILRAVDAHPAQIFLLFILEAIIIALLGGALGLYLHTWLPQTTDWLLLSLIVGLAALFSTLPAWIAYRRSLQDGLTVKI